MKNDFLKNKGFTLIELLVVIAIISLLFSIIMASLNSARQKAKIAKAQVEMRQIIQAITIAQGEQGKTLLSFAPSSNCGQCTCNPDITSTACQNQWNNAISEIQNATNGLATGLTAIKKDPWGNPYQIDSNQGEGGSSACSNIDGFWVYGQNIPNLPRIPLNPSCP